MLNFSEILYVSNFSAPGPAAAGSFAGVSAAGALDMAGNAKEWTSSAIGGKRLILGGGFSEPSYMFTDLDAQAPLDRQPTYGFRCVRYITPPDAETTRPISPVIRDVASERPVSDEIFETYRSLYRYDPTPLNATVEARDDAPDWRRETISFAAAYGDERVRAYLYLPRNATPPYQTIVYFPPGDAQYLRSSRDLRLNTVDFLMKSGRAVLYPVYKGTYERQVTITGPAVARDLTIQRSKDFGRAIDYLATRPDIDMSRLGYYGISMGASHGVVLTAIETRLRASVLLGGGLTLFRRMDQVELVNFAPRIKVPTLMVNGRGDFAFPLETAQRPLYGLLRLTENVDKKHAQFDGGHIPLVLHAMIKEILDWFDRHLGPVKLAGRTGG
jgi:dienelactone hydrolase